jgi:large subunit ribosomal protein L9
MRVILRADIDNLGHLGDVVEVRPGYARNYLVPQGLAMPATRANLNAFELERKKLQQKMDAIRFAAQELADKLSAAEVIIPVRVGENDKLYGSVTSSNIAQALAEMGMEVDRRKIRLDEPIRSLGEYNVEIRLHPDVMAQVKVKVVKYGREEAQEEAEE